MHMSRVTGQIYPPVHKATWFHWFLHWFHWFSLVLALVSLVLALVSLVLALVSLVLALVPMEIGKATPMAMALGMAWPGLGTTPVHKASYETYKT